MLSSVSTSKPSQSTCTTPRPSPGPAPAVVRGLVPGELRTAAMVVCGLAFTASGYVRGRSEVGSIRARSFSSSDWSRSSSSSR
jgi:hypothetical protein